MNLDGPIRQEFLPFHRPSIGEEEIREVEDTLRSGWITTGPKTKRFEEEFRRYIGCGHALAVSSCTAGLHLALVASGVGGGDEVVTTPYTFAATGEVILQVGARPVFVDVCEGGFNIDPEKIREAVTPRTKAIIPVHFAGEPCRMEEIIRIAREHDLVVVEDAAHALGAEYDGRKVGTIGDITAFSFYATKNITTAEGGMVTTDDPDIADKISILSLHGISRDAWKRYSSEGSWYYEVLYAGYKYNMTDVQAAMGLHQLRKLPDFLKVREEYVRMYDEGFGDMPEIVLPPRPRNGRHAWHLYVIRLRLEMLEIGRNEFVEALRAENIGTSVHFIPLHLHPYYRETFGFGWGDFPNAEDAYKRAISLPLYPEMTPEDVEDVIRAVRKVIMENRKRGAVYIGNPYA